MLYIAHRGNINGPNPEDENSPGYLMEALNYRFTPLEVEVDVWYVDGVWYTGHEAPSYEVDSHFLNRTRFWLHCKNYDALRVLDSADFLEILQAKYFWHQNDDVVTVKSKVKPAGCPLWLHPKTKPFYQSISVLPEENNPLPEFDVTSGRFKETFAKTFESKNAAAVVRDGFIRGVGICSDYPLAYRCFMEMTSFPF